MYRGIPRKTPYGMLPKKKEKGIMLAFLQSKTVSYVSRKIPFLSMIGSKREISVLARVPALTQNKKIFFSQP